MDNREYEKSQRELRRSYEKKRKLYEKPMKRSTSFIVIGNCKCGKLYRVWGYRNTQGAIVARDEARCKMCGEVVADTGFVYGGDAELELLTA